MAHLDSLQSGVYTSLTFKVAALASLAAGDSLAELETLFSTGGITEIAGIRDFPEFGRPSNIVNVPTYGSGSSTQVSGQSDLNTMEFTLNYVASDLDPIQALVGNSNLYAFQIALCNRRPPGFRQNTVSGQIGGTPSVPVQNTVFNFAGKFESLMIMPSTTDALTAKLVISSATQLFGPSTYTAV
jgi:hypothetical protein